MEIFKRLPDVVCWSLTKPQDIVYDARFCRSQTSSTNFPKSCRNIGDDLPGAGVTVAAVEPALITMMMASESRERQKTTNEIVHTFWWGAKFQAIDLRDADGARSSRACRHERSQQSWHGSFVTEQERTSKHLRGRSSGDSWFEGTKL